jgi:uncharacterized protein (DUF2249 family)
MSGCASNHVNLEGVYVFDARGVAKRFRHAAIFGALDALRSGETMRFYNDHNPLPLLEQLFAKYGPGIEVNYVSQGPEGVVIDFKVQ